MKYLTENLITFHFLSASFELFFPSFSIKENFLCRRRKKKLIEGKTFPSGVRAKLTANREAAQKLMMKRDGKIGRWRADGKGVVNMLFWLDARFSIHHFGRKAGEINKNF
jgi:hypothetical protein